jgi:hypothetical protein
MRDKETYQKAAGIIRKGLQAKPSGEGTNNQPNDPQPADPKPAGEEQK